MTQNKVELFKDFCVVSNESINPNLKLLIFKSMLPTDEYRLSESKILQELLKQNYEAFEYVKLHNLFTTSPVTTYFVPYDSKLLLYKGITYIQRGKEAFYIDMYGPIPKPKLSSKSFEVIEKECELHQIKKPEVQENSTPKTVTAIEAVKNRMYEAISSNDPTTALQWASVAECLIKRGW